MRSTIFHSTLRRWFRTMIGLGLAWFAIIPLRAQPLCTTLNQVASDGAGTRAAYETTSADEILYVPVVFHVLYHRAEENIPEALITDQLRRLNQDFRAQNEDRSQVHRRFQELIGAANIQFYITDQDPTGQTHPGITRTRTDQPVFADGRIYDRQRGGHDAWDPTRFLNVWVANLGEDVLGWATPLYGASAEEGVVVNYRWLGTQGVSLGRTLTHEIGHWLGLSHISGGNCSTDDGIADTPIQQRASTDCQTETLSCGTFDMNQNFMERAGDACMLFFTPNQAARMREQLLTFRPTLIREPLVLGLTPEALPKVQVFPNPVTDNQLHITLSKVSDAPEFRLTNLHGQRVATTQRRTAPRQWTLIPQSVLRGIYLIQYQQFYHKVIFR